jgi:hypothetical protein
MEPLTFLNHPECKTLGQTCLGIAEEAVENSFGPGGNKIRARTARRWLHTMGFDYKAIQKKKIYIDGHEWEDVVAYRNNIFISELRHHERHLVNFNEDGS